VLYELLVFKRAFGGNSLDEIADAVLNKPVPLPHELNPDVPRALSEIVARAMHRDPEQRTRSARRLAGELREWLALVDDAAGASGAETAMPTAARTRVPRGGLWSLALAGWAAALLGVGWYGWQKHVAGGPEVAQAVATAKAAPSAAMHASSGAGTAGTAAASKAEVKQPLVLTQAAHAGAVGGAASVASAASAPALVTEVRASAPASGTLKLSINPWGEVWVDGRSVGVTPPLRQLNLPAGAHTITIRNGDLPEFRQTVEVQGGKPVHVSHQF
jgi:hypothetical protein